MNVRLWWGKKFIKNDKHASTWEAEASGFLSLEASLYREFQASQSYLGGPCLSGGEQNSQG